MRVAVFPVCVAMAVVVCVTVVVRVRLIVRALLGVRRGVMSQETASIGSA
jgi:hypothetical protein